MVNGRDLSSNGPSGGTLGLISEVLKIGVYGLCSELLFFHMFLIEPDCGDGEVFLCISLDWFKGLVRLYRYSWSLLLSKVCDTFYIMHIQGIL